MKKLVLNCTEGGAHIKGTERMSLKAAIAKYCTKKIDKTVIDPFLSLSPEGDKLIATVVPMLKTDIENLDSIVSHSRKGLAACVGLKNLMARRGYGKLMTKDREKFINKIQQEAAKESGGDFLKMNHLFFQKLGDRLPKGLLRSVVVLSGKNFEFSEKAHVAARSNPLVNVAIYGASRRIWSRELKAKETLPDMLKDKKNGLIRIRRNELILKAAQGAAESLRKSYKETYRLLKKYDKTKDESLLVSSEKEEVDLSDAEDYFKVGNFAHPLLDAKKILDAEELSLCQRYYNKNSDPKVTPDIIVEHHEKYEKTTYNKKPISSVEKILAEEVYNKALAMRTKAIKEAKANEAKNGDRESRLLRYNALLESSKELGRKDKDFDKALALLRKAAKLMPEETEARWGVATALHHSGKIKESLVEYRKLIKDFPDNLRFQFEMGQVLLRDNDLQAGLKMIGEVMEKTEEFDYFLARLGEIYQHIDKTEEAALAYESYLEKFSSNYEVWAKHGDCLTRLKRKAEAKKAYKASLSIRPGYEMAVRGLRGL